MAESYGCAGRVIRPVHDNSQLGVSPPYHSPRQPLAAAYLISELSELPKIVTIFFYYPQVVQFLKSSVDRKMLWILYYALLKTVISKFCKISMNLLDLFVGLFQGGRTKTLNRTCKTLNKFYEVLQFSKCNSFSYYILEIFHDMFSVSNIFKIIFPWNLELFLNQSIV